MRFPMYKIHSLVGIFKIRLLRYDSLDKPQKRILSWGKNAAYNSNRILRIGNLPLDESEFSPWRQHILHEVSYFNNRLQTYLNRWQKAFERCFLALRKLREPKMRAKHYLWQITAFCEAARHNINFGRISTPSKFQHTAKDWEDSYEIIAWILRQKPLPSNPDKKAWDLTFTSINRDTFRKRRFKWDAAAKRAEESFAFSTAK
jgi:hypothetical protein